MMKKRNFLLSCLIGVAGLTASTAMPAFAADPVKLVISNSQWVDALRGKNLWNAMLEYNKVAPDVVLEQLAIPSAEYNDKIITEMGAGLGPDLIVAQDGLFYTLADAGFLSDLEPALAQTENLNSTNEAGVIDGTRYGLAWQRAVYAMIYNKPLLEKAGAKVPTTVPELIEAAKLVKATGAIGYTSRHQIADFSGWFMDFQNWIYGFGVTWLDDAGKIKVDTPEMAAALAAFRDAYAAEIMPVGDNMPTMRTRFKEGGVGFSIDNSGGTLNIASGGTLAGTDLYAAPLPFAGKGAHQQLFIAVNAKSKQSEEAQKFVSWLASPDGQKALRAASGPDTLATDVPLLDDFVAANPWAPTFAELAKTSHSTLLPKHEVQTLHLARPVMEALEKVIVNGADPAAALAEAQKTIDLES